jgi:hypothetical protein
MDSDPTTDLNPFSSDFKVANPFVRKGKDPDPPTNGSVSVRPKNMQILRIRIPNTAEVLWYQQISR